MTAKPAPHLTNQLNNKVTVFQWLLAAVIGIGLAVGVWWGLANGGGLVGGDTYPYFMPQKVMLAESFASGEIPLWHNLTGLGYPLHAESQAGVFYPTNQILYRLFDINTAYHSSVLLHYWLAFLFAWRFARSEQISMWPALLAAMIFVYGWFPARISLEWSIIGGLWFPLTLWITREFLDAPSVRKFVVLSACLGAHLLAGHFTLAFINQLTIVVYAVLRIVFRGDNTSSEATVKWRRPAVLIGAIAVAIGFAAIQLVPTYELKMVSQREGGNKAFDPAYGHMPPLYATQVVASWWYWHSPEVRGARQILNSPGAIAADTNAVEAHLYWGLIPLALILCSLSGRIRNGVNFATWRVWWCLLLLGLVYATGWLLPVTRHLPGFSFFMGPGRYTIVSAMGGAIISGMVLDHVLRKATNTKKVLITLAAAAVTLPDLMASSKHIADAVVVSTPPLVRAEDSWIRKQFVSDRFESRLLAPGPNVGNLFGVSCIPQYLGLGPSIYYGDELRPPTGPTNPEVVFPDEDTLEQLISLGVTHILTTDPIPKPAEDIDLIGQFPDAFLNSAWGRGLQPCFLYKLTAKPQRITAVPASAISDLKILKATAHVIEFSIDLSEDADVVLRELMFPGWKASVDGTQQMPATSANPMRGIHTTKGQHIIRWTYEPASFQIGMSISLAVLSGLMLLFISPPRRRQLRPGSEHKNTETAAI